MANNNTGMADEETGVTDEEFRKVFKKDVQSAFKANSLYIDKSFTIRLQEGDSAQFPAIYKSEALLPCSWYAASRLAGCRACYHQR